MSEAPLEIIVRGASGHSGPESYHLAMWLAATLKAHGHGVQVCDRDGGTLNGLPSPSVAMAGIPPVRGRRFRVVREMAPVALWRRLVARWLPSWLACFLLGSRAWRPALHHELPMVGFCRRLLTTFPEGTWFSPWEAAPLLFQNGRLGSAADAQAALWNLCHVSSGHRVKIGPALVQVEHRKTRRGTLWRVSLVKPEPPVLKLEAPPEGIHPANATA